MESPKVNPEKLVSIIEQAYKGQIVLPEFQRSFVWSREDIEELLVSLIQGYFIGTFLFLNSAPNQTMFSYRLIEGVGEVNKSANPNNHAFISLVLDGQQRITSLFYALYEPEIPLRKSRKPYRFYLDLDALTHSDIEDAVRGISLADKGRLAAMEKAIDDGRAVRFSLFLNTSKFYKWLNDQREKLNEKQKGLADEQQKITLLDKLERFYQNFADYMVPIVSISPETSTENIINIFERINRTGVSLSLFDLAAARLYLRKVALYDLWKEFRESNGTLSQVIKPEFLLKVVALLEGNEARKSALLDLGGQLGKEHFENLWKMACESLQKAYQRLISPLGYGAIQSRWIPYTTMLVPIAVLLHHIEAKDDRYKTNEMYQKLDRWYWGSIFTQRYDQAVDTTSYRDVREVKEWLDGGTCPSWIENLQVAHLDLERDDDQRSAVYRGIICLIVKAGAKDFITGQSVSLAECHDDHIFPKSVFEDSRINCVLNRTLISSDSNQVKSNKKPSEYLRSFLEKNAGDKERLCEILRSHLISEEAQKAMENDDFDSFIRLRKDTFLNEIEKHIRDK